MHPVITLRRLFILFALIFWLPAQAAEWSATPRMAVSTRYTDNVRLSSATHDSVLQHSLDSSVIFGVVKRHQGLFVNTGFSLERFTGGGGMESSDELDRENYFLSTNAYHQTMLDTFRAALNITRDSTLDTELEETGNVNSSRATRQSISLSPSWGRTINEKTQINLNTQYSQVTFPDDSGISRQVESDSYSVASNLSYQFNPRISGLLSATYNSFQPDTGFNSDSINLQAGISRAFSPTLSTNWLAGWRETTSDSLFLTGSCLGANPGASFPTCTGGIPIPTGTSTRETKNTGLVYTASITKLLESGSLDVSISRSTSPTSTGELLDSTRVNLVGLHRITSKLNTTFGITYIDNETIVNRIGRDPGSDNDKLLRFASTLSWRWGRPLRIALNYEFVRSDTAEAEETAVRNAVSVSLTYDFQKFSMSR